MVINEICQSFLNAFLIILYLTFPDDIVNPAQLCLHVIISDIPGNIFGNLLFPETCVCGGPLEIFAIMLVREATVDKYSFLSSGEYYVRFTGEVVSMESVAVSVAPKPPSDQHLRLGVLSFDP